MQKMLTQLEHKVGEKMYHFVCDPDSPLEHVKEAMFQFSKYIGAVEDAIKAQQVAQAKIDAAAPSEPSHAQEAA